MTAYTFPESDVSTDDLIEWLGRRAHGIPEMRQRLVRSYGDIGDAYWSDAPEFDVFSHIRERPEQDWNDVCSLLADLHEIPFDYDRPLWSIAILRRVPTFEKAARHIVVVLRFHHCMTDGLGSARIAKALFTPELQSYTASKSLSRARATAVEIVRLPLRPFVVAADVMRLLRHTRQITAARKSGEWSMPPHAPRATVLNGPIGKGRAVSVVSCSIDSLRAAAHNLGAVSVNDLVLSAVGRAVSRHLDDPEALLASVPVSIRSAVDPKSRNAVAIGVVPLHSTLQLPERAQVIHRAVRSERARFELPGFAELAANPLPRLPGFIYRALSRVQSRRNSRTTKPNLTQLKVSTIPKGSASDWQLCSAPVVANFGISPVTDGLRLNHTVSSIGNSLTIGIVADADNIRDFDGYIEVLHSELEEILAHVP
ncbi:wax ester/triacylglycerol synthase domain-containing protein [Gordonia hydrophobica]|uniref:diacylglycerol O-acyltransferase n=1 Tax=Gordonia hydrophobica TaxID=40516 RepID=A0ABZ2TWN4_9ACTN|nr:wax ester/triacylglycerol synthase domain-containing protein [Gordonia hydrophobica]MBM7369298.1 WS/DGAT/MGAT family acyltransferase [Gordonia hydrophobica]